MSCSVSTHVLDTGTGSPAAEVLVQLLRQGSLVAEARTGRDGRARLADGLEAGVYSLRFHPPSAFFRRVELDVELTDGHAHVPLLVSAYGCASYRGS